MGACFDTGNALYYGFPEHWIPVLGQRIRRVHLKDNRVGVGGGVTPAPLLAGDVNWPAVREALAAVRYDGWLTAEVLPHYRYHAERLIFDTRANLDTIVVGLFESLIQEERTVKEGKGGTPAPAFEPFGQPGLNETIQAKLTQYISEQRLSAGARLPSQSALASALRVSTLSLREAMRALEALGIVEARAGSGWYVREFTFDALARGLAYTFRLNGRSFGDLLEIRMRLEASYLPEVVPLLTGADLAALEGLVQEMERGAGAGQEFDAPDRAFHMRLFRGKVRNEIFVEIIELFWTLYPHLPSPGRPGRESLLADASSHRAILSAVVAGDAALAVRRLTESLQGAVQRAAALSQDVLSTDLPGEDGGE